MTCDGSPSRTADDGSIGPTELKKNKAEDSAIDVSMDHGFIVRALQDLVRIDSRNPGLEDDAPGEGEAARYVETRLAELGWRATIQDLGDGRCNVISRSGAGAGPSLMINVHLDTVGVAGMAEPFSGDLRDGRVWGRGAQDVKSGAAAALGLAQALSTSGVQPAGELVLAFVADEEHESLGTERLLDEVVTDAAIVIEPSDLRVCVAHRGFGVFRLRTRGRIAHGGSSELGVDANLHMARLLVRIDELSRRWRDAHQHELLGSATLHVPLLAGGRHLFVYAGECTAHVECRTVPGQSADGVLSELRQIIEVATAEVDDFHATLELLQWRQPFEVDPEAGLVRTVRSALEAVRDQPSELTSHSWWEDSALLADAGIETLVLGPVGGGLHTTEEWVDVQSVVDLAEVLFRSVVAYCGTVDG